MPVYAKVRPDREDWHIETSITIGQQAPLKSLNKEALVSAAFAIGPVLCEASKDGFPWVSFCRWTPNAEYGMEEHVDETYQLAFTQFGVAVLQNWQEIFTPVTDEEMDRPVLIYDYDAYCYLFCDVSHFIRATQAWTVFGNIFGVAPPPIAEYARDGYFADIHEYMALHVQDGNGNGDPVRPVFHNLAPR
jgi:hypothetical protein